MYKSILYEGTIIHDVCVLFTFALAKVELISFDTLVSGQTLTLHHVLRVN